MVDNCTCGIMAFPCVEISLIEKPIQAQKVNTYEDGRILRIFSLRVNKVGKHSVWHQQVFLSIVKLGPFALMLILKLFFIFQGKSAGQSSPVCQDVRNFRISLTLPMTCNFWDFFMTDQTRRYYHSSSFFQIQTFWILFWKKPNGRQTHKITRNIKEKTRKFRLLFTDKVLNSFILTLSKNFRYETHLIRQASQKFKI